MRVGYRSLYGFELVDERRSFPLDTRPAVEIIGQCRRLLADLGYGRRLPQRAEPWWPDCPQDLAGRAGCVHKGSRGGAVEAEAERVSPDGFPIEERSDQRVL